MSAWEEKHSMGKVLFEFKANGQFQIDLAAGERVEVLKQSSGWYRGRVIGRESKGIFPVSFIELLPNEPFPTATATPVAAVSATSPIAGPPPGSSASVTNSPFRQQQQQASSVASPSNVAAKKPPPVPSEGGKGEAAPSATVAASATSTPPVLPVKPTATTTPAKGPPPVPAHFAAQINPTANAAATTTTPSVNTEAPTQTNGTTVTSPTSPPPVRTGPPPPPIRQPSNQNLNSSSTTPSSSSSNQLLSPVASTKATANSSSNFHTSHRFSLTEANKPGGLLGSKLTVDVSKVVEPNETGTENKLKDNMSLESLLSEIDHTVKEWTVAMRGSLVLGNMIEYHRGMERLSALLVSRRRLQLEEAETARAGIRHEIIEMIEGSRKMAEGYMVPRNLAGQVADSNNTGVIELLDLHRSMYSALKEESSNVWISKGLERKIKSFKRQELDGLTASTNNPQSPSSTASSFAPASPQAAEHHGSAGNRQEALSPASSSSSSTSYPSATPSASLSTKKFPAGPLQLFLNVKMCIFSVGEATDLFFSLYSASEQRFVTEDYSLALSDQGLPINLALLHKMRTVFRDLNAKDFAQDLWLVCKIYRRGRLVFDTAKAKAPQRLYRRPFGCAACSLTEASIDTMIGREYEPPNAAMTIYTCADEAKFSVIHQMIIAKDKALEPAPRAKGIALGLILYTGELDTLRKTVEDMSESETPSTNKLRFPERMNPADGRNDLYVHLGSASFAQDGKKSAKNVEMSVRVITEDGIGVENCISHGASDKSPVTEYHSTVYYHLNTPFYGETIRLNIPNDLIERCHLFISFWHVSTSKKIACFSFAYLPLTTEHGAIIPDTEYKLSTYKAWAKIENYPAPGGAFYLAGENAAVNKGKMESRKEFMTIRTQSLSTFKTQNLLLHSIFKHQRIAAGDPSNGIKSLSDRFIAGMSKTDVPELVRFVRELMTTFFVMLSTPAYASSAPAIYKAIVHTINLITDPKNSTVNTAEIFEEYINGATLFGLPAYAPVHGKLHSIFIRLTKEILTHASNAAASTTPAGVADPSLLKLTKSLNYVFKLIIKSRDIEVASGAKGGEGEFKKSLEDVLKEVRRLIGSESKDEFVGGASAGSSPTQYILPSQTYLVRSLPESLSDLLRIFTRSEIATILKDVLASFPADGIQNINKLNLTRNIFLSVLGDHQDSRTILFPIVIEILKLHLIQIDTGGLGEPYICISILNHIFDLVSRDQMETAAAAGGVADPTKLDQFITLLMPIIHVVLCIQQNNLGTLSLKQPSEAILANIQIDVVVDSITILWTLLNLLNTQQVDRFIDGLSHQIPKDAPQSELQSFLLDFLSICTNALQSRCYPDMWIVMNMMECTVITKMLTHLTKPIKKFCLASSPAFVPPPSQTALTTTSSSSAIVAGGLTSTDSLTTPNHRILKSFFDMVLDMLMYDQLKIESFPTRKKVFVQTRYGDLRGRLIEEFNGVWTSLESEKMCFIEAFLVTKLFDLARGATKEETETKKTGGMTPATVNAAKRPSVSSSDEGQASQLFALQIYFDMIISSYKYNKLSGTGKGNAQDLFTQVERHTIDALYNLANLNQEIGRKFMDQIFANVSQRFASLPTSSPELPDISSLQVDGMAFLNHIARMYDLMSSLLKFPDTSLWEDERTSVALRLMAYLESSAESGAGHLRLDMYTKYVQYLVDLHLGLKNFVEAGCTTIQALKMLQWSYTTTLTPLVTPSTKFPGEKENQRKERMYLAAISYFKQGEEWERAIQYAEELRNYYQFESFEYLKLSALLQDQAECFKNIVTIERFYSNYFRVVYYGSGFDEELTGVGPNGTKEKEFVYRGVKLEPVMDFTNRIKRKWPEAKILMSSDRPNDDLFANHKQIISITTLTRSTNQESEETLKSLGLSQNSSSAASSTSSSSSSTTDVNPISASFPFSASTKSPLPLPKTIVTYRENNDLRVFIYAKGVQKSTVKNPANEFKNLWVSKTYIVTQESFPNNRRRMEIVARKELMLSPIENAISTMKNKNVELRDKIAFVANAPPGPVDVGPLSMNLNGMIDAAVNGGTQKYIEAFLSPEFLSENAHLGDTATQQQNELKQSIKDQILELKVGLDVFGRRCDEKLRGLYDHLRGFYDQMCAKTLKLVS